MRTEPCARRAPGIARLLAAIALGCAAGCGNDPSTPTPNRPPLTTLTDAPPESGRASHHITFRFRGDDYDGTVRDFDYILDTYARSVATAGQVQPQAPAAGDPRWTRMAGYTLELAVLADTLRADPRGDIGRGEFDRWHTFYVRAVDNEGAIDETPESRTFQAYTPAPRLWLLSPARVGAMVTLPRTFVMNWNGADPISGPDDQQDPRESRWTWQQVTLDGTGQPIGYPAALYDLPDTSWSSWAAWSAADSSGREAVLREVVPAGPAQQALVFAVQGRDDGGAITPQFDSTTPRGNNYAVIVVDGTLAVGPAVTVHAREESLSAWTFAGIGAPQIDVITTADTLTLYWDAPRASHYGARAGDCRYGWNIADPNDDLQWTAWGPLRSAVPQALGAFGDVFRLQCRDQIGQVTTAVLAVQRSTGAGAAVGARAAPRTNARRR